MNAQPKPPGYEDKCAAGTRAGRPCLNPAGFKTGHVGTGRCHLHGGNTPPHVASAREAQARAAAEKYGVPIRTTATEALTEELARTSGIITWLIATLGEMDPADFTWGRRRQVIKVSNPGPGGSSGAPQIETTQEAGTHPLMRMFLEERKHYAAVASDMARIGIEERQVRISEQMVMEFRRLTELMFAEVGLTPEQRERVPAAVAHAVRELAA